jgi:hypothetical protein
MRRLKKKSGVGMNALKNTQKGAQKNELERAAEKRRSSGGGSGSGGKLPSLGKRVPKPAQELEHVRTMKRSPKNTILLASASTRLSTLDAGRGDGGGAFPSSNSANVIFPVCYPLDPLVAEEKKKAVALTDVMSRRRVSLYQELTTGTRSTTEDAHDSDSSNIYSKLRRGKKMRRGVRPGGRTVHGKISLQRQQKAAEAQLSKIKSRATAYNIPAIYG